MKCVDGGCGARDCARCGDPRYEWIAAVAEDVYVALRCGLDVGGFSRASDAGESKLRALAAWLATWEYEQKGDG